MQQRQMEARSDLLRECRAGYVVPCGAAFVRTGCGPMAGQELPLVVVLATGTGRVGQQEVRSNCIAPACGRRAAAGRPGGVLVAVAIVRELVSVPVRAICEGKGFATCRFRRAARVVAQNPDSRCVPSAIRAVFDGGHAIPVARVVNYRFLAHSRTRSRVEARPPARFSSHPFDRRSRLAGIEG